MEKATKQIATGIERRRKSRSERKKKPGGSRSTCVGGGSPAAEVYGRVAATRKILYLRFCFPTATAFYLLIN